MTNTTTETLSVDGTVLNTLGYNIDLWQGTMGAHTREAGRVFIPRRPGAIRRTPTILPTPLELSMWVSERDVNGVPGGTTQMWTNLDTFLEAFGQVDQLVALQKVRQSASGLLTLDAEAEVVGSMEWEQLGPTVLRVVVPMELPYPYWEGASSNQTITTSGTITNDGHADSLKQTLTLEAGGANWVNPSVENTTTGTTLTFTGTVPASATYTIDLWEGTAVDDIGGSISGSVTINGNFFALVPGSNSITVSQTSGTGTFRAVFDPPYLG